MIYLFYLGPLLNRFISLSLPFPILSPAFSHSFSSTISPVPHCTFSEPVLNDLPVLPWTITEQVYISLSPLSHTISCLLSQLLIYYISCSTLCFLEPLLNRFDFLLHSLTASLPAPILLYLLSLSHCGLYISTAHSYNR